MNELNLKKDNLSRAQFFLIAVHRKFILTYNEISLFNQPVAAVSTEALEKACSICSVVCSCSQPKMH